MKNYILMLLALGALTAGCEKRQFDFASSYSESASYTIDLTGPFNHTTTVSLDETLDVLDVPDETDIDAIYITGGFSKNILFLNLIADAYKFKQVYTSEISNASALGAALIISGTKPDLNLGLTSLSKPLK